MSGPPHSFQSSFVNSQQNQMRNQFVGGSGPQMPGLMAPSQQQMMANQQNFGVGMPAVNNQQLQLQLQQQQQQQQQLQQLQQQQQQQQQQQVHQQQVQQQQTQQQVSGVPPAQGTAAPPNQNKEFNTASLCRFGQETVQDIVSRAQELFQNLKVIQPPNGTAQSISASNEKRIKIKDHLRTIHLLFKRLRIIYEKCNESCQTSGMEYMHIESLIPMKEEWDNKCEERKTSEQYRLACEESKEVMEQVMLKNRHLKELIDHLRRIIWEINAMLAMRRS